MTGRSIELEVADAVIALPSELRTFLVGSRRRVCSAYGVPYLLQVLYTTLPP